MSEYQDIQIFRFAIMGISEYQDIQIFRHSRMGEYLNIKTNLAERQLCRPCLCFSMGTVGLRLSGGSPGQAKCSIRQLHISSRGAFGGLLVAPPTWPAGATLGGRQFCRPYLSFSMGTVGLHHSRGSPGQAECSIRQLQILLRGAIGD